MLLIPKAVVQIPEQDPEGMVGTYFSLENQINLVQASQIPDKSIKMHPKEGFCLVPSSINKARQETIISDKLPGYDIDQIHSRKII